MNAVVPVIVAVAVTIVAGVVLAAVARLVRRPFFNRYDSIGRVLAGLDCGVCGYATCAEYAEAVALGECGPDRCAPGGPRAAHDIADIMGTETDPGEKRIAAVHCKGGTSHAAWRADYAGIVDCRAALLLENGTKACVEGCLGLGTCVRACPFGALFINDEGIAFVDRGKCTGCGTCIDACPRNLLSLIPEVHKIYLACSSHERAPAHCSAGCTGCGECVTVTPSGAVTLHDNLPRLDYRTPGENFIAAAYRCPVGCFVDDVKARPRANIGTSCNGCGSCVTVCPVPGAIAGTPGGRHVVQKDRCIGCGRCLGACDQHAISLWGSLGYEGGTRTARFIAGLHG